MDHISERYKDPVELRRLYWDESFSLVEMGEELGVNQVTVLNWMNRHDIPRRDKGSRYRDFDRLPPIDDLVEEYRSGATLRDLGEKYEVDPQTVSNRMEEAGHDRRPSGPNTHEADDGTLVKSSYERQVANWLHHNGVEYEYEPEVPWTRFVPDFLVRSRIIEVWGLMDYKDYRERRAEKVEKYRSLGLYVIDLYPEDMDNLSVKLRRELV